MNRILQFDTVELNPTRITHYDHDAFGPTTVFHDVVIARTIVQDYEDGKAYKPADELEKASWTAEGRWVIIGRHPDTTIISSRNDIGGRTINVRFTKSLKEPKTKREMDRGILADLEIFDDKIAPDVLRDMRNGKKSDVSIGFFFDQDTTPGVIGDDYPQLKGTEYDYVQRNIMIDHTAAALETGLGRCTMPACGIGADEIIKKVTGDPFGRWKSMSECIEDIMKENPDYTREQAAATCATIEKRSKEKHKDSAPRTEAERAKAHFNLSDEEWEQLSDEEKQEYIDKLPARGSANMKDKITELKEKTIQLAAELDDLVEEEYQGNATNVTLSQWAKAFFSISDDEWLALTEAEKEDYISKLPPPKPLEGKTNKDSWLITKDEFHELPLERKIAFLELAECDECTEDWEIDHDILYLGEDALTYAQKKALPDSAYAYIEAGCEKEDGKTKQSCRHMPIHDESHVRAALAALGGARTGKVPPYASKAKPKVCAAAKKFKIESEVCGTKKKSDVNLDETLEKYRRLLKDKDYDLDLLF